MRGSGIDGIVSVAFNDSLVDRRSDRQIKWTPRQAIRADRLHRVDLAGFNRPAYRGRILVMRVAAVVTVRRSPGRS